MKQLAYILWDAAHIWGLMALSTLSAMGLPCQLVKAQEITHGLLSCKRPNLLLVPGGTARLKAHALGKQGRQNIRTYVAEGGQYLGFCGGAGLGLSGDGGLGICPWSRAAYTDRMQHLVSGHVRSSVTPHALSPETATHMLSLPVWWPGRFAAHEGDGVDILATYQYPATDLCLADIPLHSLPANILGEWQEVYGVNMGADFLTGQPCIVAGEYEKGRYMLSYSHLETPDSEDANAWLGHALHSMAGYQAPSCTTAPWDVENLPRAWPAEHPLSKARDGLSRLMHLGLEHNLLFRRTPWLYGWRTGIPGAMLNNMHISLSTALSLPPGDRALAYWREQEDSMARMVPLFLQGVEGYLLAERLATTLSASMPDAVDRRLLKARREALFGAPMQGGGLYQEILDVADELVFLLVKEEA